jgi:hypothetical protein
MLERLIFFIVLIPMISYGQVEDDFSDGEINHNPEWTGDTQLFTVNNYKQLQLNDAAAGNASLFTAIDTRDTMEWQFWIRQAFSPSTNNHSRVYLMAENADTANLPDGLFLQFGEGGSNDAVRLMIQEGGDTSTVIRGSPGAISSSFQCRVKTILRNDSCYLYTDYTGNFDFTLEGSATWLPGPGTRYLGVCCKYTKSNSKKFFFDDVYAGPEKANLPLLEVNPYDIVINEIMADPTPPQLLPEYEYLELYNTTLEEVELNGWMLVIAGSEKLLTGAKIGPEDYLILGRDENESHFAPYGNFYGLESISLSNSGQEISLVDNRGRLISRVHYQDFWYDDDVKSDGGWSIEQINPYDPCVGKENWRASIDVKGGTPGGRNSVYDEIYTPAEIIRACVKDSSRILVDFNQSMNSELGLKPDVFNIDHNAGPIRAILPANTQFSSFILYPEYPLLPGIIYRLDCQSELQDCSGAPEMISESIHIALPRDPVPGDLVINEVLFNPFPGGSDYVEVYNRSDRAVSLVGLSLGSIKFNPPSPPDTSYVSIIGECIMLMPDEYILLCEDMHFVDQFYDCRETQNHLSVDGFPSYNNESGTILLIDKNAEALDVFSYHEDMHYPLLNAIEGVALERLHPDRPAYDPTNWHSASQQSGFGTPGYKNSQYQEPGNGTGVIEIAPRVCVPGYDERNNHIGIHYHFEMAGYLANIMVFNIAGQLIRHLVNNELLGTEGSYSWNGICDDRSKAPAGLYIILIELTDVRGKILKYKKTCVVAPNKP